VPPRRFFFFYIYVYILVYVVVSVPNLPIYTDPAAAWEPFSNTRIYARQIEAQIAFTRDLQRALRCRVDKLVVAARVTVQNKNIFF